MFLVFFDESFDVRKMERKDAKMQRREEEKTQRGARCPAMELRWQLGLGYRIIANRPILFPITALLSSRASTW